MNKLFWNENGFTLVEILLTISIVSILSVSILKLFSIGIQRSEKNIEISSALFKAQGTLEQIKADKKFRGFGYLNEGRYNQIKSSQENIQQTVRIDSLSADLKKIVIIIKWPEGFDSLVSMIGKY